MSDARRYTVAEIEQLRQLCLNRLTIGSFSGGCVYVGAVDLQLRVAVEEMVRTHMLAGHTAEDLRDVDA